MAEFDSAPDGKGDNGHGEREEKGAGQVEPVTPEEEHSDFTAFLVGKGF